MTSVRGPRIGLRLVRPRPNTTVTQHNTANIFFLQQLHCNPPVRTRGLFPSVHLILCPIKSSGLGLVVFWSVCRCPEVYWVYCSIQLVYCVDRIQVPGPWDSWPLIKGQGLSIRKMRPDHAPQPCDVSITPHAHLQQFPLTVCDTDTGVPHTD